MGLDGLLDLLTIGDLGRGQHRLYAKAGFQLGNQHIQLLVAGAGNDQLLGLGVVDHGEGGIFLVQPVQAGANLFFLAPGLGGDGHGVTGFRVGDLLEGDHLSGVTQGIAGLDPVHLADGTDVAAGENLDLGVLLAAHDIHAAQLFGIAGAGVDQGRIRGDFAGEDLDEGILAGRNHEFLHLAVGGGGLVVVALHGVGEQVYNVVHEHEAAQAVDTGAAKHREQAQLPHALVQARNHLTVSKAVALKEPVHQGLIGLGNGLFQGIVEFFNNGNLVFGHFDFHTLQVLHLVGPLVEDIDDAGDLVGGVPNGHDDRGDFIAVTLPEGVKGGVVIGMVLVYLGDVDKPGHIPLLAVVPCLFKAHGNAVLGGKHKDGGIGCPEGFHDRAGEIKAAGGIQNVDLGIVVLYGNNRGGNRNITADLLRVVVTDGVAVGVLAHPVDGAGHIQKALCQSGLAAAAVAQKADIANGVYSVHSQNNSFRESTCPPEVKWGVLVVTPEQ